MATSLSPVGPPQHLHAQTASLLDRARERTASGRRVNAAVDDAAGLAVGSALEAATRRDGEAARSISDGISTARLADRALRGTAEGLERMAELAARAANGLLSDAQRRAIRAEADALVAELDRTAAAAEGNGVSLLQGGAGVTVQAGGSGDPSAQVTVPATDATAGGLGVAGLDFGSEAGARAALAALETASASVARARGALGAAESRLVAAADALRVRRAETAAAAGRILDADVAGETAVAASAAIQTRVRTAVAAQANQRAADVVRLLQ